jgi:isocitrate lyase
MAANNMGSMAIDISKEERAFQTEVEAVEKWWSESRWRYTKRAFTADQIVAKRGTLAIEYASNAQSKKLWGILEARFKVWRRS